MTHPGPPSPHAREAFYTCAIFGLRALDAREATPRRFGADADARWAQFAGSLGVGDRIDILLRDAAPTWGAAFSPAACFGFFGLAEDEPFGPDWVTIDDRSARNLLAEASAPPTLDRVAKELGVNAANLSVPPLTSSTKLIVAGGAAILSIARIFDGNKTLSWNDQVLVVANDPAWRQLAGLAAVMVGARARTQIVRPIDDLAAATRAAGFAHLDAAIVSPDAEPEASGFATKVVGK